MFSLCVICADRARIRSLILPRGRGRRPESWQIFSFSSMLAFLEVFWSFYHSQTMKKRTVSDAEHPRIQGCPATEECIWGCHSDGSGIWEPPTMSRLLFGGAAYSHPLENMFEYKHRRFSSRSATVYRLSVAVIINVLFQIRTRCATETPSIK